MFDIIQNLWNGVRQVVDTVTQARDNVIGNLANQVYERTNYTSSLVASVYNDLRNRSENLFRSIDETRNTILNNIGNSVYERTRDVSNLVASVYNDLRNRSESLIQNVDGIRNSLSQQFNNSINDLRNTIQYNQSVLESQLRNGVGGVGNIIGDIRQVVSDSIRDQVSNRIGELSNTVSALQSGFSNTLQNQLNQVTQAIGQDRGVIVGQIAGKIGEVISQVEGSASSLRADMNNTLGSIRGALTDELSKQTTALEKSVKQITERITPASELLDLITKRFTENKDNILGLLAESGSAAVGVGLTAFLENLERETPESVDQLLSQMMSIPNLPSPLREMIGELTRRQRPIAAPIIMALMVAVVVALVMAIAEPTLEVAKQTAYSVFPVKPLGTGEYASLRLRGLIGDTDYTDRMKKLGVAPELSSWILTLSQTLLAPPDLTRLLYRNVISFDEFKARLEMLGFVPENALYVAEASRPLDDPDILRQSLLRATIDESQHDQRLATHGYTQEQIQIIKGLYTLIPPVSDLIRMSVREAFDEGQARALDLDAEFPSEVATWAKQQGLSIEWTKKYWRAHWELPSPSQAFEMLHRGLISEADLGALLKAADYAPKWRDKLQAIAYSPLTRVDIRRMHKVGVLTDEGVYKAYLSIGYNTENAKRLLEFTKRANQVESDNEIEPFRSSIKSRVTSAYINGVIDDAETRGALVSLGYTQAQSEAFLSEAKFVRETEQADNIRAAIKKSYVSGALTPDNVRSQLSRAGFGGGEIDRLFELWEIDRRYRDLTDAEKEARDLTRADIITAYREQLLTENETVSLLRDLGYDERESTLLVSLADAKERRERASELRDTIKAQYVAGQLDRTEASVQLDALGLRPEHRDGLLSKWELARFKEVPPVPVATLKELFTTKLLSEERVAILLAAHGWSIDVNEALLENWKGRKVK